MFAARSRGPRRVALSQRRGPAGKELVIDRVEVTGTLLSRPVDGLAATGDVGPRDVPGAGRLLTGGRAGARCGSAERKRRVVELSSLRIAEHVVRCLHARERGLSRSTRRVRMQFLGKFPERAADLFAGGARRQSKGVIVRVQHGSARPKEPGSTSSRPASAERWTTTRPVRTLWADGRIHTRLRRPASPRRGCEPEDCLVRRSRDRPE